MKYFVHFSDDGRTWDRICGKLYPIEDEWLIDEDGDLMRVENDLHLFRDFSYMYVEIA